MTGPKPAAELDCRGLLCPLPILRTQKALEALAVGQVLEMVATDPGSVPDMAALGRMTGHIVERREAAEGEFVFRVRKAGERDG